MSKNSQNTKVLEVPRKAIPSDNPAAQGIAQPASWLQVPDEETLPPEVQALLQGQRETLGLVHPFFEGFSLNPEHLLLWFKYYDALMHGEGELSPKEREIIAIVSSAANHCESCVTTHKAHLRQVIKDAAFPDRLAVNPHDANLTQREQALVNFAIKLNQDASHLSPEDLAPLRQVGLSDRAILEAGEIAAQFSLSNRLSKAFGWRVGPEYDRLYR